MSPEDLKQFAPTVKEFLEIQKKAQNQPQGSKQTQTQPSSLISNSQDEDGEVEETSYPGDESSGASDPVLETLYEAMADARGRGRYDKAVDIARQIKKVQGGMAGGRRKVREGSLISNSPAGDLDITNLGPHAEEISGEMVDWLHTSGLIPDQLTGTAKATLSGVIRQHPDIVKKGLDTLNGVLQKWGTPRSGQRQEGGTGAFDPSRPWEWAKQGGYEG